MASSASAFSITPPRTTTTVTTTTCGRLSPLFMGRAAAVRAATKGKTDAKKSKTNGIFGKKIIMAAKLGGPDPNANRALGDLIRAAKLNNVPVDNINRAIKKASDTSTANFSESLFEAYGFGGVSFVINVLTDNGNRSNSDIRVAVNKNQGKMAEKGSVLFMYDHKGRLEIPAVIDEGALMDAAIEGDIDDFELVIEDLDEGEGEGELSIVYVEPKDTGAMFEVLKGMGYEEGVKMELMYVTKAPVEVSEEEFENNMKIIDALEELDDVDSVEHNMSN